MGSESQHVEGTKGNASAGGGGDSGHGLLDRLADAQPDDAAVIPGDRVRELALPAARDPSLTKDIRSFRCDAWNLTAAHGSQPKAAPPSDPVDLSRQVRTIRLYPFVPPILHSAWLGATGLLFV
jgi:hypothetical protein